MSTQSACCEPGMRYGTLGMPSGIMRNPEAAAAAGRAECAGSLDGTKPAPWRTHAASSSNRRGMPSRTSFHGRGSGDRLARSKLVGGQNGASRTTAWGDKQGASSVQVR
eukprot:scaffold60015_cov63-Phaeocystis_antarctica.AAC.5